MLDLNDKSSNDKVCGAEMDDGGRCVLINDSQFLQPLFKNTTTTSANATAKKDAPVAAANKQKMETTTKKEVKARKSTVVATKSSPGTSLPTVDLNGKPPTVTTVNTFPIGLPQGQLQPQPMTFVPNSMGQIMSLTGTLPVNAQSVSIHPQHQTITLTSSSAMSVATNSNTIRAPTPTFLPQTQFQIGPRPMTVHLPQQLLMPGMQMGQHGLSQIVLTSRNPNNPSPSLQSGPVLQLIQTSQGTQIIKANPPTSIQQIASTATTTTTSSSKSRSNKQILPKPQSSSVSTASTLSKSTTLQSNSNNAKLTIQQQTNAPSFNTTTLNAPPSGLGGTHQFVVGPQGTFLLNNNMLPNMGSQPFFIQGNGLQNGPVQLAIRPQAPLFVNSNTLTGDSANLSISLANNAQISNNKPMLQTNQQQTFVISNANASAAGASGNLLNLRNGTPNIIFRHPFPTVQQQPPQQQFLQIQTANGPMLVALPPQPQLAQQPTIIQQPAAPVNPPPPTIQLGNAVFSLTNPSSLNLQSGAHSLSTILSHPQQDLSSIANQANIMQSNIATSLATSNNSIVFSNNTNTNNNKQSSAILPKSQSNMQVVQNQQSPKTSSSKGLNLADLLKQTGILPDFSPPTSPKNSLTSANTATTDISLQPPTPALVASDAPQMLPTVGNQSAVLMVQGGAINAHQNVLIAANNNNSSNTNQPLTTSQLRVTIGPDGTLLVVSPGTNAANVPVAGQFAQAATLAGKGPLKDSSGIGSSQPSPDSTTPSIDTSTSSPSTSAPQSVSSLISLPTSTVDQKPIQTLSRSLDAPASGENKQQANASIVLDAALNQLVVKRTEAPVTNANKGVRSTICDTNKAATPANTGGDTLQLGPSIGTLTSQKAKSTSEPVRIAPSSIAVPTLALPPMLGMVTLADVTGVPILQVNSANVEFMSRLDTQIKVLSSQTNFTQAQLDLLKELKNIQDTILRPTNSLGLAMQLNLSNSAQQLLQLSTIKNSNNMQILFTQSQNQQCLNNGIQIAANVSNFILPQSVTTSGELVKATAVSSAVLLKSSPNSQGTSTGTVETPAKTSTLPQNQVKAELEKFRPNVPKAIHQQLNADQNAALHPDCKTSFKSQDDAFKRLLRYHVFDWPSPSEKDIERFDESYEKLSQLFLRQKSQLYDKFRYLILRESMNEVPKYDQILLSRLFVEGETNALKADREVVSSGKSLNLPPLPESWVQQQREKEKEKEQSLKRKLSTEFDDDFEDRQAEKVEIADICNMLETEEQNILNNGNDDLNNDKTNDHVLNNLLSNEMQLDSQRNRDIECVDQLIDQFNSQDEAAVASGHLIDSDHQSFLDSLDNVPLDHGLMSSDEIEAFYSRIDESNHLDGSSPSPWSSSSNLNCSSTNNNILQHGSLLGGTVNEESANRMSWNARFNMAEAEAAVAVQSIMSSTEETNLSVDLSGIDELDAAMGVDNSVNFDDVVAGGNEMVDETGFLGTETLSQQPEQGGFDDMQMDCAIKSIMGDIGNPMSSQSSGQYGSQSQSFNQFMDNSMANSNSSYHNNLPYHMSSHQMMPSNMRGNSMMPYQSAVVNDTMLDEAVKSILS